PVPAVTPPWPGTTESDACNSPQVLLQLSQSRGLPAVDRSGLSHHFGRRVWARNEIGERGCASRDSRAEVLGSLLRCAARRYSEDAGQGWRRSKNQNRPR